MFWRRSRAKEAAAEETDDLAKLQKQLGITPVNDADVQAEFQALFGASGGGSPTEEERLLFGANDEIEDEEEEILRSLRIGDDADMSEGHEGHEAAKSELHGMLEEVHQTARMSHKREAAGMRGCDRVDASTLKEKVQALKLEALALKREGKIQEALVKFREAKELEERLSTQEEEMSVLQDGKTQDNVGLSVDRMTVDVDVDVEVTDEDLQNPEFLAQLAEMGLTNDDEDFDNEKVEDMMQEVSALEMQIHNYKLEAVQLKRQNQIADALTCMRKIKELEAKRDELRPAPVACTQPQAVLLETTTSATHFASDTGNAVTVESLDFVAVPFDENYSDSDNDSMGDVEVTAEDMDDPTFAAELQKLEGGAALSTELVQIEMHASTSTMIESRATANLRSLKNAPSVDEDYLIDAFDDNVESDEEADHLISVISSRSLHSVSLIPEVESSIEHELSTSESSNVADCSAQLQEFRQTALSLKREGDIRGALEALEKAKQIQNQIDHTQQAIEAPVSTMDSVCSAANTVKFQEIEQLLVDFGNRAMLSAKENLTVNREKASEWLSKRKRYEAELKKLRLKRQNPLQPPPHYEIVKSSCKVEFELPFILENQIKVSIKSVNGLSQVADKSVFVKLCLNFPSGTPHEGQTEEFKISSNASFSTEMPASQESFIFKLSRSRGTMRLFEIKKAIFEVWKPATLFRSPELVARAYQELSPLLTCCEIDTHVPFLGSNRKPCGGDIEIALQMRRPLKEKEIRLESVEDLVIGDYLEPIMSSPEHAPTSDVRREQLQASSQSLATGGPKPTSDQQSAVLDVEKPNCAFASSDDPHHIDLIISYDVINEELEKVAAKLPLMSGPAAVELRDRSDSLALKKQLLEVEMQTGKLTLDMYIERLRYRISADRALVSQLLASNRRLDAARVLHRIKVMEKELEGAE